MVRTNNGMTNLDLLKYKQLIFDFVSGKISVEEFESSYLKMVKEERIIFDDDIYEIIGTLFSDVDSYCGDSELRDDDDIDEIELFSRAKLSLKKLLDY